MRKSSKRKLFLFGKYSLALLPPKKWLSDLGVKAGDEATVEYDKAKRRLIVTFSSDKSAAPPKISTSQSSSDDWQPIPKL